MNEKGEVVGASRLLEGAVRAFIHYAGQTRDIGTLGGDYSQADAINDQGIIVGGSRLKSGVFRAFIAKPGVQEEKVTTLSQ